MTHEQLEAIRERAEDTSFNKAYVKGDPWKGYEVRHEGNGMVIAEVSCGTDADFIANAREDIPALLADVERLRNGILTAASSTHDDDTHEYLFRLLNGKERSNLPYRIGYDKDGGGA